MYNRIYLKKVKKILKKVLTKKTKSSIIIDVARRELNIKIKQKKLFIFL